jgi:predicted SnoaL-like aldol condensation-catalyzing enzyme
MKTKLILSLAATALLAGCAKEAAPPAAEAQPAAAPAAAPAQWLAEPVVGVADPDALFHSPDPKLDRNMQAAYHIVKELLECNQWADAGNWLTDKYIQHNPMAASGLQGVIDFFTKTLKREPVMPCPDKLQKTKVVAVLATGDYVTVVFPRAYPLPGGQEGETYTTTWFDMWRFVDGKADEHWDPAQLAAR